MASSEQLKALIKSHIGRDDGHFYSVAMQVAAHEAKLGHGKLAVELRDMIDAAKTRVGAPQPRGLHDASLCAVPEAAAPTPVPIPYDGFPSASLNAAALANRSAGNFSSAVRTAASMCGGMVRRCVASPRGESVITRAMIACAVGPVNGGSPERHS